MKKGIKGGRHDCFLVLEEEKVYYRQQGEPSQRKNDPELGHVRRQGGERKS